jgi:hypothetical protein
MTDNSPTLVMGRPLGILDPADARGFPISTSDWGFLVNKVSKIESPILLYNTIGSILAGTAGSALFAAIGLLAATKEIPVVWCIFCGMLFVFCALASGLTFIFDSKTRHKYNTNTKDDVLALMHHLRSQWQDSSSGSSSASPAGKAEAPCG